MLTQTFTLLRRGLAQPLTQTIHAGLIIAPVTRSVRAPIALLIPAPVARPISTPTARPLALSASFIGAGFRSAALQPLQQTLTILLREILDGAPEPFAKLFTHLVPVAALLLDAGRTALGLLCTRPLGAGCRRQRQAHDRPGEQS